ncbi:MAG: VWA domain-containing protein [Proteobacteria bacterium]|nr:VWA domain-containing protein [Pseudomonadota bacterium]
MFLFTRDFMVAKMALMSLDWARPELLYYLPLVLLLPVVAWVIRLKERRKYQSLGSNWPNMVAHHFNHKRAVLRELLAMVALAAMIVAVAQPRDGYTQLEAPVKVKNLMVAVDVSRSMLATDLKPNRLEQAKREILDLLEIWRGNQIGLIIFAGHAYPYLPLTFDYTMARLFTKSLSVDLISEQGTDLSSAMTLAINRLRDQDDQHHESKDLLVLTDGEDHPRTVIEVAKQAKSHGIRVFTMGLGSDQGAPIKLPSGSYLRDDNGQFVISKLDESTLKSIAEITGGHYTRSEPSARDIQWLYDHGFSRAQAVDVERQDEASRIWHELYMWPGWLAFFCISLAFLLTPYRARSLASKTILMLLMMKMFAVQEAGALVRQPLDPQFEAASRLLQKPSVSQEELDMVEQKLLSIVSTTQDKNLLHAAYYNLFHLYVKKKQFNQALDALKKAYTYRQTHQPTLDNLKWLMELMKQQERQQDQKNSPGKSGQDQNQENQSPSNQENQGSNTDGDEKQSRDEQATASQLEGGDDPSEDQNHSQSQSGQDPSDQSHSPTSETADEREQQQQANDGAPQDREFPSEGDGQQMVESDEKSDAMQPDQAQSLFQSLEENLEVYGRRRGDGPRSGQSKKKKSW